MSSDTPFLYSFFCVVEVEHEPRTPHPPKGFSLRQRHQHVDLHQVPYLALADSTDDREYASVNDHGITQDAPPTAIARPHARH